MSSCHSPLYPLHQLEEDNNIGSSWCAHVCMHEHTYTYTNRHKQTHSSKRVVLSPTTSKTEEEGPQLSQHHSALTATVSAFHERLCRIFWREKMKVGLKGAWSVEVHKAPPVGRAWTSKKGRCSEERPGRVPCLNQVWQQDVIVCPKLERKHASKVHKLCFTAVTIVLFIPALLECEACHIFF